MDKTRKTEKSVPDLTDLGGLIRASNIFLSQASRTRKAFLNQNEELVKLYHLLNETKKKRNIVHVTGMGRSGRAVEFFAEMLKDLGFHVSIVGRTLALPVSTDDVVIAFSGSGKTSTTVANVGVCVDGGANVVIITQNNKSRLGRLADICLVVPKSKKLQREEDNLEIETDKGFVLSLSQIPEEMKSSLSPMGTLFELSALLVSIGLTGMLRNDENPERAFQSTLDTVIDNAEKAVQQIMKNKKTQDEIVRVLDLFLDLSPVSTKKVFWIGAGLSGVVASMHAMRFQHLGFNIHLQDDWRFRKKNDVIVAISGSGSTPFTNSFIIEAKKKMMITVGFTSIIDSEFGSNVEFLVKVPGRLDPDSWYNRMSESKPFIETQFEFAVAIVIESIIAQLAIHKGITETEMKGRHANIE
ncbi:MAG: SIS domain-containing protein [Candidatus Heimdallarchaeota archaeon]|nr:SIS domain-containing protein [Candidatus Heimdallarchaeota archaeon]MBY8993260.1 SIS domain-containing protein [Candidatus Heimdallarchaeota archaeon]